VLRPRERIYTNPGMDTKSSWSMDVGSVAITQPARKPLLRRDQACAVTAGGDGGDVLSQCNTDIYVKDVVTKVEQAVCTDPAAQDKPDIEGDVVAWLDCREQDEQHKYSRPCLPPYVMKLSDRVEHRINLTLSGWGDNLRLNGGRLFFESGPLDGTPTQVFMVDLHQLGLVQ
jgi:hypothetical protein